MSIFIRKVSFPTNTDISSFGNDIVPKKIPVRYGHGVKFGRPTTVQK